MNLIKTFTSFDEGISEIVKLVKFDEELGFDESFEFLKKAANEEDINNKYTEMDIVRFGADCFLNGLISYPSRDILSDTVFPIIKKYNPDFKQISVMVKLNNMVSISWSKTGSGDQIKYKIMFTIAKNSVLARKYNAAIALTEAGWSEVSNPIMIV